MPLSIEAQKKTLKALKYPDEEINKLVGEGENDVTIPELKVFLPDEYTTLETNLKESSKSTYIKVGRELLVKEMKDEMGLEYDGKDPKVFIEKAKEKIIAEAKLPIDKAKEQWETEKRQLQEKLTQETDKLTKLTQEKQAIERDSQYVQSFPKGEKAFADSDLLVLLKTRLQEQTEDGKTFFTYNGTRLQDNLSNDLDRATAINHVFEKENWMKQGDPKLGRGGSNTPPSPPSTKPGKMSEAEKAWNSGDGGINPDKKGTATAEFQTWVGGLAKENKDFNWSE